MKIAGSAALVTGGASGLGLATVRRLHDAGASVVILDLPSSNGTAMAKELGARAAFAPGDVTSQQDVEAAFDGQIGQAAYSASKGETIRLDGAIRMAPR